MPLDAKIPRHLDERRLAALGKLNDPHPFGPQTVTTDLRQLGEQPDLGLPLHQQPATGKQRHGAVDPHVEGDLAQIVAAVTLAPQLVTEDILLTAHQPPYLIERQGGEQIPRVGCEQLLARQLFQQPPRQRQHGRVQPALRVLQDHDGAGPLLQLPVAPRLQQSSRHPRHRQLQRAVIGAAQKGMQVARIAQCHGAIDDVALTARLVLDGSQGVEVVIHQLAHRLQRLFELRFADPLGFIDQLVRQLAQAMLGEISPLQCLHPVASGTGVPQPEHRVHGDKHADQLVGVGDGQALAYPVEKVVNGEHRAIRLQLGAGAIVNAVEFVLVQHPGGAKTGQATGVLTHLGSVLTEGEHQLQVARRGQFGIFRLVKILGGELIGLGILPQQTPEGAQQA